MTPILPNNNNSISAADLLQLFTTKPDNRLTPQSAFAAVVSGATGVGNGTVSRAGSSLPPLPDGRTITTSGPSASDLKQLHLAKAGSNALQANGTRLLPFAEEPDRANSVADPRPQLHNAPSVASGGDNSNVDTTTNNVEKLVLLPRRLHTASRAAADNAELTHALCMTTKNNNNTNNVTGGPETPHGETAVLAAAILAQKDSSDGNEDGGDDGDDGTARRRRIRKHGTASGITGQGRLDGEEGGCEDLQDDDDDGMNYDDDQHSPGSGGGRKRIGRPLAFNGDPDDPGLSEEERRKIKRRIANRESARRVRHKRQELMEELQHKCALLSQQNARLLSHATTLEQQRSMLASQVTSLRDKYACTASDQASLRQQVAQLQGILKEKGIPLPFAPQDHNNMNAYQAQQARGHQCMNTSNNINSTSASLTAALNALTATASLPGSAFQSATGLQPLQMGGGGGGGGGQQHHHPYGMHNSSAWSALPVLAPSQGGMKYM